MNRIKKQNMGMEASQLATMVIVAGIALEKIFARLDCYNGVKSLHLGCSSCCDFDMQRSPTMVSPPRLSPVTASPPATSSPIPEPVVVDRSHHYSAQTTPTVDELMRRVSMALAKPNASD